MTGLNETEPSSLRRFAAFRGVEEGWLNPAEPTRFGWLLLVVTVGYGSYSIAAGPSQRYGGFQASTPPGYEYYPEYPSEPAEYTQYTQRQETGYSGSYSQWPQGGSYADPFSWSTGSNQGFKYRDLPAAAPKVEQPMPRFRPDSLSGRSPYSWGREDGRWPGGSIGPPPVFRPLENGSDRGGTVKRPLRYSGGEYSNRRPAHGRAWYESGSEGYRPLSGR